MAHWSSNNGDYNQKIKRYHTQAHKNGISFTKTLTNKFDAQRWAKEQEVSVEKGTFTIKKS
jgi:aromatic ring hydroxylase